MSTTLRQRPRQGRVSQQTCADRLGWTPLPLGPAPGGPKEIKQSPALKAPAENPGGGVWIEQGPNESGLID